MKKKLSLVMAIVICLLVVLGTNVFAANWPAKKNIQTYGISTKNDTPVYKTAKSNDGKYGTIYASDLIKIKAYDKSSDRFKVSYPTSKGSKTGYIKRTAITSAKVDNAERFTASEKYTAYRRSSGSSTIGYVSKGDVCYKLTTKSGREQVIYPISGGYKIGWIEKNNYNSSLRFPIKGSITRSSSAKTNGFYCDYKAKSGTPVYAPADGKVTFRQSYATKYNKLASYGNSIVFKSSNGVYEVTCAHLSKFNGVSLKYTSTLKYPCGASKYSCKTITLKTKNVKKGDLLGYTGMTGNASGPHLHLEVKKNGKAVNPTAVFSTWN